MRIVLALTLLLAPFLSGCLSVSDMSAQQLKATNGMAMCSTVATAYGRGSSITVNADDIRKGASAKGKTEIRCGDAVMVIEGEVK